MGRNPTKCIDKPYCDKRKEAAKRDDSLNSREGAAEKLGISASTLADYELGITTPSPENILRMSLHYHCPELRNYYCVHECPIGDYDATPVDILDLDRIVIKLMHTLCGVGEMKQQLLDITEDGIVDEVEKVAMLKIYRNLDKMIADAQNLKCWIDKNLKEV